METPTKNGFIDKIKINPATWVVIVVFIATIAVALNNIGENSKDITNTEQKILDRVVIIETRLTKKIGIQNEIIQDLKDQKIYVLEKQLESNDDHWMQQVEIERLIVHIEYLKREHK